MRVKPVDPNAVIRDPHTKRALPAEGADVPEDNFWTRRWLGGEVWKRDGKFWVRREATKLVTAPHVEPALEQEPEEAVQAPTGREPIAPLTTREVK